MIAIAITPYLCFVFFGEGFNPFFKPSSSSKRSKWRRGRAMALAAILGIACAMVVSRFMELESPVPLVIGVVVALAFAAAFSARKIARFLWGHRRR